MNTYSYLIGFIVLFIFSCKEETTPVTLSSPKKESYGVAALNMSKEERYDKILGALVGSAIGDAMGASTEMWDRAAIQQKYGYINGLTPTIRELSPEGPWEHNLSAGATTDDTRWKYLMVKYVTKYKSTINAVHFSKFITDYYQSLTKPLSDQDKLKQIDFFDEQVKKIDWIKEWARVAFAYQKGDTAYQEAQNRFYGGEMSCAGMLYTPIFGLLSSSPEAAYNLAYTHTIFDIGYAKDISSTVAAMTQMAMQTTNMDSIVKTATFVDPKGYQDSRLIARLSHAIADAAEKTVIASKAVSVTNSLLVQDPMGILDSLYLIDSIPRRIPKGYLGTKTDWVQQEFIYRALEKNQKAIAFHTGEIWEITYTALLYGEGNFEKTMQFIVNYGRDNDTVAAVAGMILGTKDGYTNLPATLKHEVLRVNKEILGIDLKALAKEMTDATHLKNE